MVALLLSGCAGTAVAGPDFPRSSGTETSTTAHADVTASLPSRWTKLNLGGGTYVRVPPTWHTSRYRGATPTVYYPLSFVSNQPLTGPCAEGRVKTWCNRPGSYFPPNWVTPRAGVIILWSQAAFPSPSGRALAHLAGKQTHIGGRLAKVKVGTATSTCPAEAATEVDAYVPIAARSHPGLRYDMTACIGPDAHGVLAEANRMLASIHVASLHG